MWCKLLLVTFLGFTANFGSAQPGRRGNLAEVAAENGFNTLLAAATATGQAGAFAADTPGGLTVFAPTDAAFDALPPGALDFLLMPENGGLLGAILAYHVVPGTVLSTDLFDGLVATTLSMQNLTISATMDGFSVEGAAIGPADVMASNGVIHVIDQVLIPPGVVLPLDIIDLAVSTGQFPTLVAAVTEAGLVAPLKSDIFTVFAPSENAFAALPAGTLGYLLRNVDVLTTILTYHVVAGSVMSSAITDGLMATTLEGNNVTFAVSAEGAVSINDMSNVVAADIVGLNGVIHVIDSVLLPPDIPMMLPPAIPGMLADPGTGMVSTLITALQATGLDTALAAEGPFTLLAPVDSVLANLPPATLDTLLAEPDFVTLKEILTYHVIPGIVDSAAIVGGLTSAATLQGEEVMFGVADDGSITVGGGSVVTSDIYALNGVIMTIDTILVPSTVTLLPGIAEVGIAYGKFNTLFTAIQAAGLGGALAVDTPLTVFAPTDEAFIGVDVDALLADVPALIGVLTYHVVGGKYLAADLADGQELATLAGFPLHVSIVDGTVMINDAVVTDPNLEGSNGVIHGISRVVSTDFMKMTSPPVTPAPVMADTPAPTPAPVEAGTTPAPEAVATEVPTGEDSSASMLSSLCAAGLTIAAVVAAF